MKGEGTGLRRTLCAAMREVSAVKVDEANSGAPREQSAGKMKAVDFAVLIFYKPSTVECAEACFLWKNGKLEKISGVPATAQDKLAMDGYHECQKEFRLVTTPVVFSLKIDATGRERRFETEFLVAGAVHASVWVKEE